MHSQPAGASRGQIFAWTLFDFANTSFSVIVVTVIYSRYFTNHVAGGQRWLWGLAVSISMICAALLSPPLGAAADFSFLRKRFLFGFTLLCITCTALLFLVGEGMVTLGIILFVLANIGFEGGLVFYDAFLPALTSRTSYGRVSGYGFAMGYVGALAVLVIVMLILPSSSSPEYYYFVRLSFVVAALFFLIFSIPLFIFVPEPGTSVKRNPARSYLRAGVVRSIATLKSLIVRSEYPSISRFLVAFFLYNDGILTVIAFAAIFAERILRMGDMEIIVFFAIVQTSALVGSLIFGILTDKIGPKKSITLTLLLWIGISVGSYFVATVTQFYGLGLLAGIAMGSSQSSSRSMMALLTPANRAGEFFGFYDGLCGKASGIVGPFVYGIIADLTDERMGALAIGAFFIAGLILLQRVIVHTTSGSGSALQQPQHS